MDCSTMGLVNNRIGDLWEKVRKGLCGLGHQGPTATQEGPGETT